MHTQRESHTLTHRHRGEKEREEERLTHVHRDRGRERMGVMTHVKWSGTVLEYSSPLTAAVLRS